MTTADLIAFKNYILTQNTYFDKGFAPAFKDEETGRILHLSDSGDFVPVMPMDKYGTYFYLRTDGKITHTVRDAERATDHGASRVTFIDTLPANLVIIYKGLADEFTLMNNIRNTALSYTPLKIFPIETVTIRELIVSSEMNGMDKKDISATLQRLKGFTMVSVKLSINKIVVAQDCITDPCKNC